MLHDHDEGPVYYREIQKNAYLKRIPNEPSGSKLRPLGHKKPPLKPMWTLFCVHNGRAPYLEQYPVAECPMTASHTPVWRACLLRARHVTASVKPRAGQEYDFLVDTDNGPVRMVAPDWESMQDWVTTLRNKLHELRILSKGENVYCPAPAAPPPRAAARDPTSPLPPTPPTPPDRVPGIELTTPAPRAPAQPDPPPQVDPPPEPPADPPQAEVDISSWDDSGPVASTSASATATQEKEPKKSLTKICGQSICLDDSILKRSTDATDSDEEFFNEIDQISGEVDEMGLEVEEFRQTVMVADRDETNAERQSNLQATNITVIQVSNKPPHTAIPVLGPETDVFNFNFTRNGQTEANKHSFVNIVNTEVNVNSENGYGTVFSDESDYGHLSLTTTVNLTDVRPDDSIKVTERGGVYERLCMASTSNETVTKLKKLERVRKSSLPNLDTSNSDTTYEYLFPSQNEEINRNATVTVNAEAQNGIINSQNDTNTRINSLNDGNTRTNSQNDTNTRINPQNDTNDRINPLTNTRINSSNDSITRINSQDNGRLEVNSNGRNQSTVTVGANMSFNARAIRSSVERSHSQNAYDTAPGRENVCRRVQNSSPKRDTKNDKTEVAPAKPIWKRGLTELSLLTRLRGIGQSRRHQSPTGQEGEIERINPSPAKAVHHSRAEARVDSTRRRSSSLTNGQSPPTSSTALVPLRRRQALSLQAEQRRRAAIPAAVPLHSPPVLAEYDKRVWIAWWSVGGSRCNGRCGDRLAAVRGTQPRDLAHARQLFKTSPTPLVDILFHRVPLGKIYVFNKRDQEHIGIKLDSECLITSVEGQSPAARAGIPPPGKWAVTEVNNRPINLIKGGEEEMNRLSVHGTEVLVLIQPAPLVKKLRSAIKANKTLLSIR